ncbi:MAG: hypothetical protein JST47_13195 [Bacteroidetes bacterium]|nr:hypothetical protein [Bacteroidota bacterium]
MDVFSSKSQAIGFAALCKEENLEYHIFYASSMMDVFRRLPYGMEAHNILSPQNKNIMNQENFDYLKNTLKYMGFGDKLNGELEDNIKKGIAEINLNTKSTFNNKQIEAVLSFRKGEQNEMYFFNKYSAAIVKDGQPDLDRSQTFYVNRGNGVTLKEAFNLLEGRAVHKNLTDSHSNKYNAWLQLDFNSKDKHGNNQVKQYHQNYGYDLEKALGVLPIKELESLDDRKLLMDALKKGNLWEVNIERDGSKEKIFIEANPKQKTINAFDLAKLPIKLESLRQEKSKDNTAAKEEKNEKKNEEKKHNGKRRSKDSLEEEGQSQGRRK